jgi:hippurate hydrolase
VPREPELEHLSSFPSTVNDQDATDTVTRAFAACFGRGGHTADLQTASEDMSEIPAAFDVPYTYWRIGGTDPTLYESTGAP